MNNKITDIPVLSSIDELAETSDAWLVDVWGVIHNGVEAFAGSCAACSAYRAAGGYVVLITNAPRPSQAILPQLEFMKVSPDCYDAIVSSGDVTRHLVSQAVQVNDRLAVSHDDWLEGGLEQIRHRCILPIRRHSFLAFSNQ